jgi:hypothetical protein
MWPELRSDLNSRFQISNKKCRSGVPPLYLEFVRCREGAR